LPSQKNALPASRRPHFKSPQEFSEQHASSSRSSPPPPRSRHSRVHPAIDCPGGRAFAGELVARTAANQLLVALAHRWFLFFPAISPAAAKTAGRKCGKTKQKQPAKLKESVKSQRKRLIFTAKTTFKNAKRAGTHKFLQTPHGCTQKSPLSGNRPSYNFQFEKRDFPFLNQNNQKRKRR
jgi:hypothetical protein